MLYFSHCQILLHHIPGVVVDEKLKLGNSESGPLIVFLTVLSERETNGDNYNEPINWMPGHVPVKFSTLM